VLSFIEHRVHFYINHVLSSSSSLLLLLQSPFLSLGDEINIRTERHRGSSSLSGDFVVEDIDVSGDLHRRLIFLSNKNLVQSEASLVQGKAMYTTVFSVYQYHRSFSPIPPNKL